MGVLLVLLLMNILAFGGEYSFVEPLKGKLYVDDYFNKLNAPDIKVEMECAHRSKVCWYNIINEKGRVIDGGYNTETNTLSLLGKSRYDAMALAFVERTYKVGKNYYEEYFLIDNRGRKIYFKNEIPDKTLVVKPLKNGNILFVTKSSLYEASPRGRVLLSLSLPRSIEYAYAGNNLSGEVSVVAVGGNDILFINYEGGETSFVIDRNALATRGDRRGILSIYPDSRDVSYAAIYRYVNPYNKGIVLYHVDFSKGAFIKGFLFNSEKRNVGFDPSVFSTPKAVIVSAKNSTEGGYLHFIVPKNKIAEIEGVIPEHIKGFEEEKEVEFIVSTRLSMLTWNALSEVKKGDVTYAKVKYDMSNSLFYGASLEGRIGDTQIAITYMQNKAEEKGGLSAETSRLLSAVVDFHGLVGKRNTLRIGYEQGKINGIAKFTDVQRGITQNEIFETDLKSYYAYIMMERGLYYGLEYLNYKIPSAVGFSDAGGNIVVYDFDKDFTLNSLLIVLGYDHVSYSKRYETNYNDFYFAGNGGLGLGMAKVSSSLREQAKSAVGASDAQIPLYIVVKAYGEIGYLYQRRAKVLKGFGFSINAGYRLTFMLATAGNDGDGADPDKVYLEFQRYELLHGPFLQANIIF